MTLKPVLSWKSHLAQVKRLPAGTAVSYGLTERLHKDSTVAVVPVGYYDGLPRAASSKAKFLVRGVECKVLGRVCMNMCVIDVSEVKGVKAGDEVVLIGRQRGKIASAEALAESASTINYEIIARINPLTPRVVVK